MIATRNAGVMVVVAVRVLRAVYMSSLRTMMEEEEEAAANDLIG